MASPSSPIHSTPPPDPPSAVTLALPAPTSSRRLPPPCWSHDETVALIDAYRDKWYSLGRGNLKANHWQEVADAVTHRCPNASPPKTPIQCRHKMEKLRKRYRTEIQRARSLPVSRFSSSWVHFKLMDFMEKGPSSVKPENDSDSHDEVDHDDEDEDQDLLEEFKNGHGSNTRSLNKMYRNGIGGSGGSGGGGGGGGGGTGGGGFRIRIPTGLSAAQPGSKFYGKVGDQKYNPNLNHNPRSSCSPSYGTRVLKDGSGLGLGLGKRERDPVADMVRAIKVLGDGFVRMEKMKMEMAREIETMRIDMEMKRTEMILESQQRIVETFAKAVSEKKKKSKRMPSPPEP